MLSGTLNPFSAYVALSLSRRRDLIRLLQDIDNKLFTTYPLQDLRYKDERLENLDRVMEVSTKQIIIIVGMCRSVTIRL